MPGPGLSPGILETKRSRPFGNIHFGKAEENNQGQSHVTDAAAKTDRSGGLEEGPREGFQEEEAEERERGNKKECPREPEVDRKEGSWEAGDAGKSDLYRPQGLQGGYGLEFPAAAAQKVGWLSASPKAERGWDTARVTP